MGEGRPLVSTENNYTMEGVLPLTWYTEMYLPFEVLFSNVGIGQRSDFVIQ